jgi:hypothetical protein
VETIGTLPVWDQIEALYFAYTGHRATDPELFGHWYALYDHIVSAGQTPNQALYQIAEDLAQKPAAQALYPLLSTSPDLTSPIVQLQIEADVDQAWENIFGHDPAAAKATFWEDRVLSGAVPLDELPARIENHAHGANATKLLDHVHDAVYATTYTSGGVSITVSEVTIPAASIIVEMAPGETINANTGSAGALDVMNFTTGAGTNSDVLDFSVAAGGLTGGTLAAGSIAAGLDAVIGTQTAGSNVAANVTLIEITDQTFANASALATALEGSEHLIFSGSPAAGGASHVLVAYNDGTGSARIAEVGVTGSSPDTHLDTITGSDLVQLIGVNVTSLNAHNVHFLA